MKNSIQTIFFEEKYRQFHFFHLKIEIGRKENGERQTLEYIKNANEATTVWAVVRPHSVARGVASASAGPFLNGFPSITGIYARHCVAHSGHKPSNAWHWNPMMGNGVIYHANYIQRYFLKTNGVHFSIWRSWNAAGHCVTAAAASLASARVGFFFRPHIMCQMIMIFHNAASSQCHCIFSFQVLFVESCINVIGRNDHHNHHLLISSVIYTVWRP